MDNIQNQSKPQLTVLIVDDDADHRNAIAFHFRRSGFLVHLAESGGEAWKICQEQPVHLILTDVCMPGGTGIQLLNLVRERHSADPAVFLMSGHALMDLSRAQEWGADAVFEKPLDRNALLTAFQAVMDAKMKGGRHEC